MAQLPLELALLLLLLLAAVAAAGPGGWARWRTLPPSAAEMARGSAAMPARAQPYWRPVVSS